MQNTSSAVMQQRHEPDGSLDDFPTRSWATRALFERVKPFDTYASEHGLFHEPACGRGHMSRAIQEYVNNPVLATDVHDYGHGAASCIIDYLDPAFSPSVWWTVTNPPFKLAEQFILKALATSRVGVAMLVRSAFLEGVGRHERLFKKHPPAVVAQFTERVPMHRSRMLRKGSTATAYSWLVWLKDGTGETQFMWIPPCRKQLERDSDYFWSEDW